jgi:hypothetical protein
MCEMCRFISWTLGLLRHWVGSGQERTKWSNRRPDPPPREPRRLGAGGRRRRRRPRCYQVAPLSCPVKSLRPPAPAAERLCRLERPRGRNQRRARKGRLRMEVPSPRSRTQHTLLVWKKRTPPPTPKRNSRRPSPPPRNREGKGGAKGRGEKNALRGRLWLTTADSAAVGGSRRRRASPGRAGIESNRIEEDEEGSVMSPPEPTISFAIYSTH